MFMCIMQKYWDFFYKFGFQAIKFHHYLRIIVEFLLGPITMVNILNDCLAFTQIYECGIQQW